MPKSNNGISFTNIVYLDDLLRNEYTKARQFIYTILYEPLRLALNITPPPTRSFPQYRGLSHRFEVRKFIGLCGNISWNNAFHAVPNGAASYLATCIPDNSIVIGYEMPPWLIEVLSSREIAFVSIRISPIRFCRDLYFAVDSNLRGFHDGISSFIIDDEVLYLEAGLLRASIQHNARDRYAKKEKATIFIGQTGRDASLVNRNGDFANVLDFSEQIRSFVGKDGLLYAPHPLAGRHRKSELRALKRIVGYEPITTKSNIYEILAGKPDVSLFTISSGSSQEARYFHRECMTLQDPLCKISTTNEDPSGYKHIRVVDFLSPNFWSMAIKSQPHKIKYGFSTDSLLRRMHNMYWGYSDFMIRNDKFWRQVLTKGSIEMIKDKLYFWDRQ